MLDNRPLSAVPAALDGITRHRHTSAAISAALDANDRADGKHAVIMSADGQQQRFVRNLGWLLRHSGELLSPRQGPAFTLRGWRYGKAAPVGSYGHSPITGQPHIGPVSIDTHSPVLCAHLADGRTYACAFADAGVLLDWLDRPSFQHLTATVDLLHAAYQNMPPSTCAIGGLDWKRHVAQYRYYLTRGRTERLYSEYPAELTTNRRDKPAPVSAELRARLDSLREANRLAALALDISELRSAYKRATCLGDRAVAELLFDAVGSFLGELPRERYFPPMPSPMPQPQSAA